MKAKRKSTPAKPAARETLAGVRPLCRVCGFAKGGLDSWDGQACKCGLTEPPIELVEDFR